MLDMRQLETVIWAIADGDGTDDDLAVLHADERASLVVLDRLIVDTEEDLASVRNLRGEEREQVIADFTELLDGLRAAEARLRPPPPPSPARARHDEPSAPLEPGPVELQASWADGQVVVWAAGRGTAAESNDELATRLEAIGGPPLGWQLHQGVPLPGGQRAEALSIPVKDALGWLVAVNSGAPEGIGASVRWLALAALEGVRLVARGSIVPTVQLPKRPDGRIVDVSVRWVPALADNPTIEALVTSMPGTVTALGGAGATRATTQAVLAAVVETIVGESVEHMELPAPPPQANSPIDLADMVIARMDGSSFRAGTTLAMDLSRRLEQWSRSVTSTNRPHLVVQLDDSGPSGVWLVSVMAVPAKGKLLPIDAALRSERTGRLFSEEWARLGRMLPTLDRAGVRRRGQVALSQDEAWEFMTVTGPTLAAFGFDVRVPQLSRRKATPSLRLFAETPAGSVVGAHQLSNVSWTVLFDDVELTAAEVARLAKQARPLVQSRGKWVEVDRVDLGQGRRCARRAGVDHPADRCRDPAPVASGSTAPGSPAGSSSTATAGPTTSSAGRPQRSTAPVTDPDGFVGELRTYQAEALAWIGFLDAAELGGCLALDMGLGKTPTVLAHLARTAGDGPALVIAPAAVVGNWAAEAAQFAPGLRVLVHHGAARAERRAAGEGDRRRRHRDHDLRHRGARRRRAVPDRLVAARARRGAGDQEPGERDRPAAAPAQRRAPGWR